MKLKRNFILFLPSLLILISSLAVEGCATAQINFEDVNKKAWYTEAVNYVAEEQIMVGIVFFARTIWRKLQNKMENSASPKWRKLQAVSRLG